MRISGNNRTKNDLIGLHGVVRRSIGLGGWHWLVLPDGDELKIQRNALTVVSWPTGREDPEYSSSEGDTRQTKRLKVIPPTPFGGGASTPAQTNAAARTALRMAESQAQRLPASKRARPTTPLGGAGAGATAGTTEAAGDGRRISLRQQHQQNPFGALGVLGSAVAGTWSEPVRFFLNYVIVVFFSMCVLTY